MKPTYKQRTTPSNVTKATVHQILGTKLAGIIKLSEEQFNCLINEIESNPLFEKLRHEQVVRYKRFPKTGFRCGLLQLNENISVDTSPADVEPILETHHDTIQTIKEIGIEKFNKYFLYNDDNISIDEIKERCGIGVDRVKKIIELLNEISIHSQFYNSSGLDITAQINYNKMASVDRDKNDFIISFFSPNLARGRYEINYDKLVGIKGKNIKTYVRNLELVNLRKTSVYRILEKLVSIQRGLVNTGNSEKKRLLTQRMLSREINVDPSIICRIVMGRSIENPSGKEIPLKDFF